MRLHEGKSFGSRRVFASEKTVLMSTFVRLVGSLKANLDKRMITKAVSDYASLKGEFKDALFGILGSYQKGEITSEIMETLWRSEIKDAWEKAYEHGMRSVGNPFGVRREDESWIKGAETQEFGYLGKFVDDIKNKELVMGMEKRLDMYVETLDGVFHHGQVEGSPEFVKIYWHLREAKHCNTCIRLAAGSPYTRKTLPAVPRDGTSECLSSCKCFLQFRYMKEEPEPEEFVVKAPKPVIPPEGYRLPSDKERDKLGQMSTEIDRLRGLIPATSGEQKKELIRQRRDLNIKQISYMKKHKVYYVPLGQTQKVKFTESIADEVRKELLVEGGPGSGNYGHAGRPTLVGGSGAGSYGNMELKQVGKELPDHISKIRIPPSWTGVYYNPDPKADVLVTGKDLKGRTQIIYSERHQSQQAEAKFMRVKELHDKYGSIYRQNEGNLKNPDATIREHAEVTKLIMKTGIRPGSEKDTKAKVKAYGATTLEGRHVVVDKAKVNLQFVGKKGIELNISIKDEFVSNMLRTKKAGDNDQLFRNVNDGSLRSYVDKFNGRGFKTKDFRTEVANDTAEKAMSEMSRPKSKKEYKKSVVKVAKIVAGKLGNTPAVALKSYINPGIFGQWRSQLA